jgi:hypothetical protein
MLNEWKDNLREISFYFTLSPKNKNNEDGFLSMG